MAQSSRRKPRSGSARSQGVLQNSLVRLWQKMAAEKQPPAIDRFLARELGKLEGMSRRDRLWIGDILTDILRFGALTVFAEGWRRDGWQPESTALDRLTLGTAMAGPEVWRRLSRMPAPIVFFWTFMRKRLTGAELPAIAPPGPHATEVWRTVREEAAASDSPLLRGLWAGLPAALAPLLAERAKFSHWSPAQTCDFLDRHALRPPVWLRVLDPHGEANLRDELTAADFACEGSGPTLQVRGESGVYELAAYRAGIFDIQDLASQSIGDAVAAQPGDLIWDACAGAGGKSLQLASALKGQGTVWATDLHESKLNDLRKRAKRANLDHIKSSRWDGQQIPDFGQDVQKQGGFDRVLVDAPCSGAGTWRRNVDGRLRFDGRIMNQWTDVQSHLLALTAQAVRPGGHLIYATCSWLPAENEAVRDAFLADHPQWRCTASQLNGNPAADSDTTFWAVFTY